MRLVRIKKVSVREVSALQHHYKDGSPGWWRCSDLHRYAHNVELKVGDADDSSHGKAVDPNVPGNP